MPAKELYTLTRKKEKLKIKTHADSREPNEVMAYPLKIHAFPKLDFFVRRVSWAVGGRYKKKPWFISERLTGRSVGDIATTIKRAVLSITDGYRIYIEKDMLEILKKSEHINDPLP